MAKAPEDDCPRVRWGDPREFRLLEKMGADAYRGGMPEVRFWLLDTATRFDPLYGEADRSLGDEPGDDQPVGENGESWLGPFVARAHVVFSEASDTTPEPDENGIKLRNTCTVYVPRDEFRRLKMVEAPAGEGFRLPREGDVVEIYDREHAYDPQGVGPYYFPVQDASFGDQIGNSNYWVSQILVLEMSTRVDPSRLVGDEQRLNDATAGSITV